MIFVSLCIAQKDELSLINASKLQSNGLLLAPWRADGDKVDFEKANLLLEASKRGPIPLYTAARVGIVIIPLEPKEPEFKCSVFRWQDAISTVVCSFFV